MWFQPNRFVFLSCKQKHTRAHIKKACVHVILPEFTLYGIFGFHVKWCGKCSGKQVKCWCYWIEKFKWYNITLCLIWYVLGRFVCAALNCSLFFAYLALFPQFSQCRLEPNKYCHVMQRAIVGTLKWNEARNPAAYGKSSKWKGNNSRVKIAIILRSDWAVMAISLFGNVQSRMGENCCCHSALYHIKSFWKYSETLFS